MKNKKKKDIYIYKSFEYLTQKTSRFKDQKVGGANDLENRALV